MNDEEIIRIGRSAEVVLNSEAFTRALDEIEGQKIRMWADGIYKTPQEREDAYALVRGAKEFRSALNTMLDRLKISRDKVERNR